MTSGVLQEDVGRVNEARALYESVLRADPGFQPARQHIFRLGAKDGRLLLLPVQPGIPR